MSTPNRQVQASALRHQVLIQREQTSTNALGEPVQGAWVTVASVLADPQPLRGREYFAAGQMQAPHDVRFRIRHRAGITPTMRVMWQDEPHAIDAVIDVEGAGLTLELMCTKGLRDGR